MYKYKKILQREEVNGWSYEDYLNHKADRKGYYFGGASLRSLINYIWILLSYNSYDINSKVNVHLHVLFL